MKDLEVNLPNFWGFGDIDSTLTGILELLFEIGGVLAVIAIVYSGIMYITAGGDSAKAGQARKNLTWAVTGLIVMILSYSIVSWIAEIIINGEFNE